MPRIEVQTNKDEVYTSTEIDDKTILELRNTCRDLPNYATYTQICDDGKIHTWRGEDIYRMSIILEQVSEEVENA